MAQDFVAPIKRILAGKVGKKLGPTMELQVAGYIGAELQMATDEARRLERKDLQQVVAAVQRELRTGSGGSIRNQAQRDFAIVLQRHLGEKK